jgi:membrane protein required for colicin V production
MTMFDYVVLFIIAVSVLVSLMRGAVKEFLSIAAWVLAFYVAQNYASLLIPLLPEAIPSEMLKMMAAFLILFLAVLFISSLISIAITSLLSKVGIGWFNRLVGALFGLAKGLLIVCVLVFLAGMTQLPKDALWTNAMLSAPLEALVKSLMPLLPPSLTQYVSFE